MLSAVLLTAALSIPTNGTERPHAWGNHRPLVKSESVSYCPATGMFEFEIKFTQKPDFSADNEPDVTHHSFRYMIWSEDRPYQWPNFTAAIFGPGLYDPQITIKDIGPWPDVWGETIGLIDYLVLGKTIRFSVPQELIGSEVIYYRMEAFTLAMFMGQSIDSHSVIKKNCDRGRHAVAKEQSTWGKIKAIFQP